ncbi:hypothetical protein [Plebeiibacterium marinum]|uniref:ClpX-type ZB domain-containing protein n=1 Tax=Plebeiibacterium marinum TaxID=2992111 RepID=A0AAE3MBN7_9BACT|nr:hypothetical protein [Plebeiobacterium marinum]MCW3804821.1 hypothetical protein [Plebeiobacterium marinum]
MAETPTCSFSDKCFVCGKKSEEIKQKNPDTNLPVCDDCIDTEEEKKKVKEAIESLGDGFICGCI